MIKRILNALDAVPTAIWVTLVLASAVTNIWLLYSNPTLTYAIIATVISVFMGMLILGMTWILDRMLVNNAAAASHHKAVNAFAIEAVTIAGDALGTLQMLGETEKVEELTTRLLAASTKGHYDMMWDQAPE